MRLLLSWLAVALALAIATPAAATWHEAKSRHFIIHGDADPNELSAYAKKLELFDQAVRMARGMNDPPLTDAARLRIYYLRNPNALAEISSGSTFLGEYIARASGSYAFVTKVDGERRTDFSSDIIFFHEYAHHLMLHNWAAALPTWFSEGFAEFFSTARIGEDGSVTLGAAANHRAAGVHAFHRDLTLTEMLSDNDRWLTGWQREIIYARGWLLTHYLTFEPSRRGQLDRYIAAIQQGQTPLQSARAAFGDLGTLDGQLKAYAVKKEISGIVLRPDAARLGPVHVRQFRAAEVSMMPVRLRLDYGVSQQNSRGLAARARRLAEPYAADAGAQATLAQAEFRAGNYAAANAAAERAIAIDPGHGPALISSGRARMELAKAAPRTADWTRIRSLFVRANRADTENAEPLMLNYKAFVVSGASPTASAIKGLHYALVLAPQDAGLRLMAVRQLLLDGQIPEARQTAAPLAFSSHARRGRDTARNAVQAIDAGKPAEAVKSIETWLE